MEKGEERRRLEVFCLITVLCTRGVAAYLDNWIELLQKLIMIVAEDKALQGIMRNVEHLKGPTTAQFFGVLFGLGMSEVDSVSQLEAVIDELDRLNADGRRVLLTPVDDRFADYSELVHLPWMKGTPSSSEIADAVTRYERMAEKTRNWGFRALSLQCSVAQAVMLDEFGNDKDAAFAVLDRAAVTTGEHIISGRAVARIHWRHGEHATALRSFRNIVDRIGDLNPIERAFALREAAISAARTDDWGQAIRWFLEAQSAAEVGETSEMAAMAVGLGADAAVAAMELGDVGGALRGLMGAVGSLSGIDAKATLRSAYCHHVVRHAVLWAYARAGNAEIDVAGQPVWLEPGTCSNPEPAAAIRDRPLAHVDVAWYLLAEAEIAAGVDVGLLRRLEGELGGNGFPAMELRLRMELIRRAIDRVDADAFAHGFREYIEAAVYVSKERRWVEECWDGLAPNRGEIPKLNAGQLCEGRAEDAGRESILAYAVCAGFEGRGGSGDRLEDALTQEFGSRFPGEGMLRAWKGGAANLTGLEEVVVEIVQDLESDEYMEPGKFCEAGARLYEWCGQGNFVDLLVGRLAKWQRQGWRRIVDTEGFRLVRPWATVPRICSVLERKGERGEFVAEMIVAGSDAVGARLSPEYLEQLQRTRKSEAPSEKESS